MPTPLHHPSLRQFCTKCYLADYYQMNGEFPPLVYDPAEDGCSQEALKQYIAQQGPLN